jgi:hypothetical protein
MNVAYRYHDKYLMAPYYEYENYLRQELGEYNEISNLMAIFLFLILMPLLAFRSLKKTDSDKFIKKIKVGDDPNNILNINPFNDPLYLTFVN